MPGSVKTRLDAAEKRNNAMLKSLAPDELLPFVRTLRTLFAGRDGFGSEKGEIARNLAMLEEAERIGKEWANVHE